VSLPPAAKPWEVSVTTCLPEKRALKLVLGRGVSVLLYRLATVAAMDIECAASEPSVPSQRESNRH
jgi:hypothetical protein